MALMAAAAAGSSLLPALSNLAPLASLLGGGKEQGDINVSQSATNTTGVSLTNVLHNLSPGNTGAKTDGSASGSSGSTASSQPNQPAGYIGLPNTITPQAASNIDKYTSGQKGLNLDTPTIVGIGVLLGAAGYFLTRKAKRKGR